MKATLKILMIASVCTICTSIAFAQKGPAQQQGEACGPSQMIHVFPGLKQRITGLNREEQRIAREVRHELALLPRYTLFDDITFCLQNRNVILGGNTITVGLKRDAGAAVKGIEGVENVVNNIEELPPSPMDRQIRAAIARAIFNFDGLSKYAWEAAPSIHIVVKNGHVRLEGVVDNQADKNMVQIQAKSVPNVFSVTNNLQVASGS